MMKKETSRKKGRIGKFFLLNFKLAIFFGLIGFIVYLIFSPIQVRNDENYIYSIYTYRNGKIDDAIYVKNKSDLILLTDDKLRGKSNSFQKIHFLSDRNRAWVLDTINEDIVKFRAKEDFEGELDDVVRGYTLLDNVHME